MTARQAAREAGQQVKKEPTRVFKKARHKSERKSAGYLASMQTSIRNWFWSTPSATSSEPPVCQHITEEEEEEQLDELDCPNEEAQQQTGFISSASPDNHRQSKRKRSRSPEPEHESEIESESPAPPRPSIFGTLFSPVVRLFGGSYGTNEEDEQISEHSFALTDMTDDSSEMLPMWSFEMLPPLAELPARPFYLPRKTRRSHDMTLVLDLDETLVHCSTEVLEDCTMTFEVSFHGADITVYARVRPHVQTFLEEVSKMFDVIIFTASQKLYADKILDLLDPKHKYIKHRLFREHCVYVQGTYVKELGVLGRDLGKTLIVDNSPYAFAYQISNGVPIKSWFEDPEDTELLSVLEFLENLHYEKPADVRPILRETFEMHEKLGTEYNGTN